MILRKLHKFAKYIDISNEVKTALEARKPVVALESTIITHGMPFPHNKHTALEVESIIWEQVSSLLIKLNVFISNLLPWSPNNLNFVNITVRYAVVLS
jgi:hypothetical protein